MRRFVSQSPVAPNPIICESGRYFNHLLPNAHSPRRESAAGAVYLQFYSPMVALMRRTPAEEASSAGVRRIKATIGRKAE